MLKRVSNRARRVLSIKDKIDLITEHCENGICVKVLAKKYGVGVQTAYDLIKNKDKIFKYQGESYCPPSISRHTVKETENPKVEYATYQWCRQQICKGTPITGDMVIEKAKFFHSKLNSTSECKYSRGWLDKFKLRNNIHLAKAAGEKLYSDYACASMFVNELAEFIKNEQLTVEQIYNADATSLFWKCLPPDYLADNNMAAGWKESKERLTALVCANAAGTHKLKLLLIGKSASPSSATGPRVVYKTNKMALLTPEVFMEWFYNNFVREIQDHIENNGGGFDTKVLLLLANCPALPEIYEMNARNIFVKCFPPNCTSLIQPMNQGVIRSFKSHYRKFIVQELLNLKGRHEFEKSFNINNAIWTAVKAWDNVSVAIIMYGWQNLLSPKYFDGSNTLDEKENVVESPDEKELIEMDVEYFAVEDISNWIECDVNVATFAFKSDDDIVKMTNHPYRVLDQSSDEEFSGDKPVNISLTQALDASSTLLAFLGSYKCPGITKQDYNEVQRIQQELLHENIQLTEKEQG